MNKTAKIATRTPTTVAGSVPLPLGAGQALLTHVLLKQSLGLTHFKPAVHP